eukprot:Gregarina_sp_Poly_1__8265@NODE_481_length_8028_cov_336_122975_g389_i0_p9_GENE_NODE_481_length_8028_cov_336_122975_g389_i0NODE_481_length_8028_cov_336_122975_g389_i0_p9_ORF_typecomplete_len121_score6_07Shisa/PF13908_6/2_6e03Shisa/PF13908_6/0_086COX14/PF14880_6/0_38_NODE_481_length_8028_cov_336_122975_g389_i054775839
MRAILLCTVKLRRKDEPRDRMMMMPRLSMVAQKSQSPIGGVSLGGKLVLHRGSCANKPLAVVNKRSAASKTGQKRIPLLLACGQLQATVLLLVGTSLCATLVCALSQTNQHQRRTEPKIE